MSKFIYDTDIPGFILPDLKRYFDPRECLIPAWCTRVFIGWQGGDADNKCVMDCDVRYCYRWARITVYGRWTNQPDSYKPHAVTHELLHITLDPLYGWALDKIKGLCGDDGQLADTLKQDASERIEAITEDIAEITERLTIGGFTTTEPLAPSVKPNGGLHEEEAAQ